MSDLKHSHYIPILPLCISKEKDSPCRQASLDQAYVAYLKQELIKIMSSLHSNIDDIGHKYIKKEEHQKIVQQKQQLICNLAQQNAIMQNEIFQGKIKIEQLQRFTKRYKMNEQLLNNNIQHLKKTISEKEAIIKYLQEKKQKMQKYSSKGGTMNDSIINQDFSRTYSKPNLSFAKLKPSSNPRFQDFSNCSLRFDQQESFGNLSKGRSNRIKTQSTQLKENDQSDNIKTNLSIRKLKDFFKLGLHNNLQNQKTLTKTNLANTNGSLWQFASSKNSGLEPKDRRRHSNFNSSNCIGINSSEYGIKQ